MDDAYDQYMKWLALVLAFAIFFVAFVVLHFLLQDVFRLHIPNAVDGLLGVLAGVTIMPLARLLTKRSRARKH